MLLTLTLACDLLDKLGGDEADTAIHDTDVDEDEDEDEDEGSGDGGDGDATDDDGDGYSEDDGDCDDDNPFVSPDEEEREGNGIDDDCDGDIDEPSGPGGDGGDGGDGGGPGADVTITEAGHDCDNVGYWIDVYTTGEASVGDLYLMQTGSSEPWDEYHPVEVYSYDPFTGTNLYVELDSVDSVSDVVSGSTTLFDCSHDATITWLLDVFDAGGTYADCLTWGHDPSYYTKLCTNAI